jgi:hypothetical protein
MSSLSLLFSLQQNWRRGWNGSKEWNGSKAGVGQTMYTHLSKCKNVKIKKKNNKKEYLLYNGEYKQLKSYPE